MTHVTSPMCWICGVRPAATVSRSDAHAHTGAAVLCVYCNDVASQPYETAWQCLSTYLLKHWNEIVTRGSFDLAKAFSKEISMQALQVHLHFVKVMGCKLKSEGIEVDLTSFSAALTDCTPHPEVTLLVADSRVARGALLSHQSDISVLRRAAEVHSALWTYLTHPVAIKVCYIKTGAPVHPPVGSPWHPLRQRKIVKLSPYKGDTQSTVARRDLRL